MESFTAIEKMNSTQKLTVKDFEDGNINLSDVMEEVNYLKNQIIIVRQEMAAFLTGIATIEPSTKPQQVFEENTKKATNLQRALDDYVERYKKLTPLLDLVTQDLNLQIPPKQEPQIKQTMAIPSAANTPNMNQQSTANAASAKKAPQRKRTYTKKTAKTPVNTTSINSQQSPNPNGNTFIMPSGNGAGSYQAGSMIGFNSFQPGNKEGGATDGSENQPILL